MVWETKKKARKNKKRHPIFFIFLFLVGFGIMIYPLISNFYYRYEASRAVEEFRQEVGQIPDESIQKRIELAIAYNRILDPRKLQDPYSEEEKAGVAEYARMLEAKEKIGYVEIPRISERLPIYAGSSEEVLQKGVGHLEGSSLPVGGDSTHTVLTAHRGLPSAKLFTNLDHLQKGDQFYIHNIAHTLAYEVDQIIVVEPSDFDPVLVVAGKDYATLLTCTPYMVNSHRLLVRGHRIPFNPQVDEKQESEMVVDIMTISYLVVFLCILLVLIVVRALRRGIVKRRKRRERKRKCEKQ